MRLLESESRGGSHSKAGRASGGRKASASLTNRLVRTGYRGSQKGGYSAAACVEGVPVAPAGPGGNGHRRVTVVPPGPASTE